MASLATDTTDLEDHLRQRLAVVARFRLVLLTLSVIAAWLFWRTHAVPGLLRNGFVLAAYLTTAGYFIGPRVRAVPSSVFAYSALAFDAALASLLVFLTGGLDSIFAFLYVFVVLEGAMTLYRRGAVLGTLSCLLLFAVVVTIQFMGAADFIEKPDSGRSSLSFFMYGTGLTLVAYLASTLAETARKTGRELASTEHALSKLEELQAAILRSLPAGLMMVDAHGRVEYANESAHTILGAYPGNMVGQTLSELVPAIAVAWRECTQAPFEPSPRDRFEGNFVRGNGTIARLGFSFAPLSASADQPGTLIVFQDVTDIVRLKESVERAERLATIGKFAAGLAHEVRNPLASICTSVDILKESLNPPESLQRLMNNVVRESERLDRLISEFLNYARPRELTRQEEDLSQLTLGVIDLFRTEAASRQCELTTSIEASVMASFDPDRLKQVLWNLLRNALEAVEPDARGRIHVTLRSREGWAQLSVTDSGRGIETEQQKRIFDPFFTTKERGTGLGLPISHSIIEAHGGRMLISSQLGKGTEMTVLLPLRADVSGRPALAPDITGEHELAPSHLDVL